MLDRKLIELLLSRIPKDVLENYADSRIRLPRGARKRDMVRSLIEDYQMSSADLEELESIVAGQPPERGFNVFLYRIPDMPNVGEMLTRVEEAKDSLSDRVALEVHSQHEDHVTVEYQFAEDVLVPDQDGQFTRGTNYYRVQVSFWPSERRAEVYTGSAQRAARVADDLGILLHISFQRLVRHDLKEFRHGTLDPLTVLFLELLYNRLNQVGRIENVQKLILDSSGVEQNLELVDLKGHHLFESPQACKMLLRGQRINGVRFLYRLQHGDRHIVTYVTLVFREAAGLKLTIAQQNWPFELVQALYTTIRALYENLVDSGEINKVKLDQIYRQMVRVAEEY